MDEQALGVRVEGLARELARTINSGAAEGREHLRELAIGLIREDVNLVEETAPEAVSSAGGSGSFNAFGVAIPLFLTGMLLVILFPPVGVLLFMAAFFMMGWGVLSSLFTRH